MTRRALGWTLAVLFISMVSGGAAWHFNRAIEDVTIVLLHVEIDPDLPHDGTAKLWLGGERLEGRDVWLSLSGRARRPFEFTGALEEITIDRLDRTIIASAILPGVTVEARNEGGPPFVDVLLLTGEHPARAFRGYGTIDGERHPWLWVLASEPEETTCGLALRASHGGIDLIDRDVILEIGTAAKGKWRRTLTRQNITERTISIRFSAPSTDRRR